MALPIDRPISPCSSMRKMFEELNSFRNYGVSTRWIGRFAGVVLILLAALLAIQGIFDRPARSPVTIDPLGGQE